MRNIFAHNLSRQEQRLLEAWENASKQGQLGFWVLLSLKHSPKYMAMIKDFISSATDDIMTAEENSLYRTLRRFKQAKLVTNYYQPSDNGGPEVKVYKLTESGHSVLSSYLDRNIITTLYNPSIRRLITKK